MAVLADVATSPARALARAAAGALAEAMAIAHKPAERARHRRQLEQAIEIGNGALTAARANGDPRALASALATLAKAHAARASDARHGAGQLALGAQRAPTREACDDGWCRVETIVTVAEESAAIAARLAAELDAQAGWRAAHAATTAASQARRLIDERNHAYTFHAVPSFSFGEGWYVAAAAVLAGIAIQIEPGKSQTAQAECFLRAAGLGTNLVPYRPRPRANKHLPAIIADAFRADPSAAQRKLRAAFLGQAEISMAVTGWIERKLAGMSAAPKVLLWIRHGTHHPTRNTPYPELLELVRHSLAAGLVPMLIGDDVRDGPFPAGAVDLTFFWKDPVFQGPDMRRAQLQFFEHLGRAHRLVGQLGVTTAGMDGPALMGLPTMYLTDQPNLRLGTWVGTVPGYEEVLRGPGYLERIDAGLRRWAGTRRTTPAT